MTHSVVVSPYIYFGRFGEHKDFVVDLQYVQAIAARLSAQTKTQ